MKLIFNKFLFIAFSCTLWLAASCNTDFFYTPKQFVAPTFSVPLVSRDTIKNFIGASTYDFKLAFTNARDEALYIVDFSRLENDQSTGGQHPAVITMPRDPARPGWLFDSPLLSPDGRLVTYFLRSGETQQAPYVQDVSGKSAAVAIAPTGTDPHFWQDAAGALYVIYSDKAVVPINQLESLTGFATYRQKIDPATGSLIGDRTVLADKPFNGGLSKNGRYLCTGYADGAFYDLLDSQFYRVNYTGSNGIQICNPSINPTADSARQDQMLFLPFAGTQQLKYASEVAPLPQFIGMHEYLIIVDKNNTVLWDVRCPSDHFEWQDPEWSNRENFVVALAKISTGLDIRHDCYLVRRSDNALLKLTSTDSKFDYTATPSLWIAEQE